jgi:cell wall-associated NlpC family hydrolase
VTRFRLIPIAALIALAVTAAPASAHHWHDGHGDGYPQQEQQQDNQWDEPQSWDQPQNWDEPQSWDPPQSWNQDQGDSPETPEDWNHNDWHQQAQQLPTVNGTTVGGRTAMLRTNGQAAIPRGAPARVRSIIRAANAIIGKPYKWGGGHGRLVDSGYDCSGSISYALIRSGQLSYPMVSGSFARWARSGNGKYVTIYANRGHVYMEVAGLRLDTSAVGDYRGKSGVRWRPLTGKRVGFAVRHIAGL